MRDKEITVELRPYSSTHLSKIETLLDDSFGVGRFAKTAYRLREKNQPLKSACLTLWHQTILIGSLEYWPILIDDIPSLLLGPIALHTDYRGLGYAALMINKSSEIIDKIDKYKVIMLIGDECYYNKYGYTNKFSNTIDLPAPVDKARLLVKELRDFSLRLKKKVIVTPAPCLL